MRPAGEGPQYPNDQDFTPSPTPQGSDAESLVTALLGLRQSGRGQINLGGPAALLAPLFQPKDDTFEVAEKKGLPLAQKFLEQRTKSFETMLNMVEKHRDESYKKKRDIWTRAEVAKNYKATEAYFGVRRQLNSMLALGASDQQMLDHIMDQLNSQASEHSNRQTKLADLYQTSAIAGHTQAGALLGDATFWDRIAGPPATDPLAIINAPSAPKGDVSDPRLFPEGVDAMMKLIPSLANPKLSSFGDQPAPTPVSVPTSQPAQKYLTGDIDHDASVVRMGILDSLGSDPAIRKAFEGLLGGHPEALDKLSGEQVVAARGLYAGTMAKLMALHGEASGMNPAEITKLIGSFLESDPGHSQDVYKAKELSDRLAAMVHTGGGANPERAKVLNAMLYTLSAKSMPLMAQATEDDALNAWYNLQYGAKSRLMGEMRTQHSAAELLGSMENEALTKTLLVAANTGELPDLQSTIRQAFMTQSAANRFTEGFQRELTTRLGTMTDALMAPGTNRKWSDLGLSDNPQLRAQQLRSLVKIGGENLDATDKSYEPYPNEVSNLELAMQYRQTLEKYAFDAEELAKTAGPVAVGQALLKPDQLPPDVAGPPTPSQDVSGRIAALPDEEEASLRQMAETSSAALKQYQATLNKSPMPTTQPTAGSATGLPTADYGSVMGATSQPAPLPGDIDPDILSRALFTPADTPKQGDAASPFIYSPTQRARKDVAGQYREQMAQTLKPAQVPVSQPVPIAQPGAPARPGQPGFAGPQQQPMPRPDSGQSLWGNAMAGPGFAPVAPRTGG